MVIAASIWLIQPSQSIVIMPSSIKRWTFPQHERFQEDSLKNLLLLKTPFESYGTLGDL